ncbi:hypothetical protein K503DRAFT_564126 [Rhizopogon vinicolor AM-OR11-026]|uniref:Uncharacterized protein n=1 Tax=Rhizopogon vinicolor AM-OR11-026 TaxID=1314800 RepID=A0A1B7N7S4_9AGAM|nr:hypothetical protein K503DRAFT_564126 [Rhizopogon vinicolor AM-OR11-026]
MENILAIGAGVALRAILDIATDNDHKLRVDTPELEVEIRRGSKASSLIYCSNIFAKGPVLGRGWTEAPDICSIGRKLNDIL